MKDTQSIRKIYNSCLNGYYSDYERCAKDSGETTQSLIVSDLKDKGFTEEEATLISQKQDVKDSDTIYKFVAYAASLANEFDTIDELNNSLADYGVCISDEDGDKVIKASKDLT